MSERPIECGECKRAVKIFYKEITSDTITCTEMCDECPVFKAKLAGDSVVSPQKENPLCCGVCGTSLESVKMSQPLGCPECYTVFANFILSELIAADGIPSSKKIKPQALHIGSSPQQPSSVALSSKLASLSEALNEALRKENYEQAAWLRDQIKAMTDQHE